jgi:ectoine hydroxylase-related dioxygenase (phytanoyl-CoA dioxygenase family)
MTPTTTELTALTEVLYRDGIVGLPGALPRSWGDQLASDATTLLGEALARPGGTINRGRNRVYFSVHPQRVTGLSALLEQPQVAQLAEAVLGHRWRVVEVAFDVPLPGSRHQPWHRDFTMPAQTRDEQRLTSLAVNATAVDVTPQHGPFEIVPGTHWDPGDDLEHGMFVRKDRSADFDSRAVQKLPRQGDLSVRTGLTIHRGSPNRSTQPRPVLIVGLVGPEVDTGPHGLQVTEDYLERLPAGIAARLDATVVKELRPLPQTHDIEGLVMGDE